MEAALRAAISAEADALGASRRVRMASGAEASSSRSPHAARAAQEARAERSEADARLIDALRDALLATLPPSPAQEELAAVVKAARAECGAAAGGGSVPKTPRAPHPEVSTSAEAAQRRWPGRVALEAGAAAQAQPLPQPQPQSQAQPQPQVQRIRVQPLHQQWQKPSSNAFAFQPRSCASGSPPGVTRPPTPRQGGLSALMRVSRSSASCSSLTTLTTDGSGGSSGSGAMGSLVSPSSSRLARKSPAEAPARLGAVAAAVAAPAHQRPPARAPARRGGGSSGSESSITSSADSGLQHLSPMTESSLLSEQLSGSGGRRASAAASKRVVEHQPAQLDVFDMRWNNEALPQCTLLHLSATDTRGLLLLVTRALTDSGLVVRNAQVSTMGGVARDQFHVADKKGCKVLDAATQQAITERVRQALTGITRRKLPVRLRPQQRLLPRDDEGREYTLPFDAASVHRFDESAPLDDAHEALLVAALRATDLVAPHAHANSKADAALCERQYAWRLRQMVRRLTPAVLLADVAPATQLIAPGEEEHALFVVVDGKAEAKADADADAKVLAVGEAFGIGALLAYSSAAGAAVAAGAAGCSVLALPHSAVRQAARQTHEGAYEASRSALAQAPLLKGLCEPILAALARCTRTVEFATGEALCSSGEPLAATFFLIEGEAVIRYKGTPMGRLRRGDSIGEPLLAVAVRAFRQMGSSGRSAQLSLTGNSDEAGSSGGASNVDLVGSVGSSVLGVSPTDENSRAAGELGSIEVIAVGRVLALALDPRGAVEALMAPADGSLDAFTGADASTGLHWNWGDAVASSGGPGGLAARSPLSWLCRASASLGDTYAELARLAERHTQSMSVGANLAGVNSALDALASTERSRLYVVTDGSLVVTEEAEIVVEGLSVALGDDGTDDDAEATDDDSEDGGGPSRRAASVRVHTRDREDLLATILHALQSVGLVVVDADISTHEGMALDSFAVLEGDGSGDLSDERAAEVEAAVREAMVTHVKVGDAFVWRASALGQSATARPQLSCPSGATVRLLHINLSAAAKNATNGGGGSLWGAIAAGTTEGEDPAAGALGALSSFLTWSVGEEAARAAGDAIVTGAGCQVRLEDLRLLQPLGAGGFAVVRLAKHRWSGAYYAVKLIPRAVVERVRAWPRVCLEAQAMLSLPRHPLLLRLHAAQFDARTAYLVMDHMTGGDLFTLMVRFGGRIPERVVCFMVACVVLALEHIHEHGWAYRDVKPENILIDAEGYARLADFGFARPLGKVERTFSFVGTPEYMAPECLRQAGHSASADWWALGVTAYQLLTGETPFARLADGHKLRAICDGRVRYTRKGVSSEAASLIRLLLTPDPGRRPAPGSAGAAQIRRHRFFAEIDWARLTSRAVLSPYLPPAADPETQTLDESVGFDHLPELAELAYDDPRAFERSPLQPLVPKELGGITSGGNAAVPAAAGASGTPGGVVPKQTSPIRMLTASSVA